MATVLLPPPWMICKDGTPRKKLEPLRLQIDDQIRVALERMLDGLAVAIVRDDAHVIDCVGLRSPADEPEFHLRLGSGLQTAAPDELAS